MYYKCESEKLEVRKCPEGFRGEKCEIEESKVEYRILGSGLVSYEYERTPLEA